MFRRAGSELELLYRQGWARRDPDADLHVNPIAKEASMP
jgi:hypothetical protein